MTRFRHSLPALAIAIIASCNDAPVSPDEHIPLGNAAVVVTTDTILATRDVTPTVVYIRVRFPVSITNTEFA